MLDRIFVVLRGSFRPVLARPLHTTATVQQYFGMQQLWSLWEGTLEPKDVGQYMPHFMRVCLAPRLSESTTRRPPSLDMQESGPTPLPSDPSPSWT